MSNTNSRVLTRVGARELAAEEIQQITGSGSAIPTLLSVIRTGTPQAPDERLDS